MLEGFIGEVGAPIVGGAGGGEGGEGGEAKNGRYGQKTPRVPSLDVLCQFYRGALVEKLVEVV